MKFLAKKTDIEGALNKVETIVPARDMQTLLSNVLVRIESDQVIFTASDMESTAQVTIEATSTEKGEIIVKAKKLLEIAKKINSEEVSFNVSVDGETPEEGIFQINIIGKGGQSARFKMTGNSAKNFPGINMIGNDKLAQVSSAVLSEMISKTIYAISQDDNRYVYNGLFLQANGKELTIVGTDGRRLTCITRNVNTEVEIADTDGADTVIHSKAIRELQRLLQESDEVSIGKEQKDVFFKVGNAELSSRLLDGKFPDFNKVIPKDFQTHFIIDRESFLSALRQVMVMTEQPSYQVKLSMENKEIILNAHTPDIGEAEISLPVVYEGNDMTIGFNATYLNDILKSLTCPQVKVLFIDSSKPMVIHDLEDEKFVALVMPMRI